MPSVDRPHPQQENREIPRLPGANAIAAVIVAIASFGAAIAVLMLVTNPTGIGAAGTIGTAGLALAGRLGIPHR
jgi:hypothetical protein